MRRDAAICVLLNRSDAFLSHSFTILRGERDYRASMARTSRQILGQTGEELALQHYERLGFLPLARNDRTASGELDLIVADRVTIVFVEVKTARVGALDPLDSITPRKLLRVRRLAAQWLSRHPELPYRKELRFDVVAIVLDDADRLVSLEQFIAVG